MGIIVGKSILQDLAVREAMRRQVPRLPSCSSIAQAIRYLIKYKVNALLTTDEGDNPEGVVSKTDIMGAYYASLPVESPLSDIMMGPPLFCTQDEPLDAALGTMRSHGVYRLYVSGQTPGQVLGVLAYPDIVGLLYRLCFHCDRSLESRRRKRQAEGVDSRYRVSDVMTASVVHFSAEDSLFQIMEGLSSYRFGAVLVKDEANRPRGVISKTDLVLAYKRGIASDVPAKAVLASDSVLSCDENAVIEGAIRMMIFSEVHRIFVHRGDRNNIVGVLSLSDVARLRSGSCHACVSSRIRVDDYA